MRKRKLKKTGSNGVSRPPIQFVMMPKSALPSTDYDEIIAYVRDGLDCLDGFISSEGEEILVAVSIHPEGKETIYAYVYTDLELTDAEKQHIVEQLNWDAIEGAMEQEIAAYGRLRYLDPQPARHEWQPDAVFLCPHPDFPEQADGIREGWYHGRVKRIFRAGIFGSYGEWLAQLCRLAHGVEPEVLWNKPQEWKDKPFSGLIMFSDCNGIIGPKTSARLYEDFVAWQDKAQEQDVEDFFDLYLEWMEAFKVASRNGVVEFC